MKTAAAIVALAGTAGLASADLLANWTFETSVPTTAGPHAAEGGINAGGSFATGFHVSGATAYSNPVGNGSFESFSSNNWGIGDYYQFTTSTVGYNSILFGWSQTASSTGPQLFDVEWSTNGTLFSTLVDDYVVGTTTWSSGATNPLSVFAPVALPAAASNLPTVWIRLTNQVTPGGTGGTNRVDNIMIEGTLVPAPGSLALLGLAGLVARRRR
ncbi:MAG: hypothetical protein KDA05_04470 [Phycisphaerales bacterium]|nr:hypothetical protein [Phycisphaerales bacterium]MCB9840803.1 hypothetical protein [Phycisphaeraceae bacterium]